MEISEELKKDITDKFLSILDKASSNGFSFKDDSQFDGLEYMDFGRFVSYLTVTHDSGVEEKCTFVFHFNEVVFNHNFAKAFFGDQEVCPVCGHKLKGSDWKSGECSECGHILEGLEAIENWQYHLKNMVVSNNPIEYLIENK